MQNKKTVTNIDSKEALLAHAIKIKNKGFLHKLYTDFYREFRKLNIPSGPIVELGSGAGFLKEIVPEVITSDVIAGPGIDKVFSATKMPFGNKSISAFVMFDVFHHIKNPEKALTEMYRCLKNRGKILMIEPFPTRLSYLIYKFLHPERRGFNLKSDWRIPGKGRMSAANPAIPWIIFARDKKVFQKKFPKFNIIRYYPHTPFRYLVAGGLSDYQLLPTIFYNAVCMLEDSLSFLNKHIAMFITVELKKDEKKK